MICGFASSIGGWVGWHMGFGNSTVGFFLCLTGASVCGYVAYKLTK